MNVFIDTDFLYALSSEDDASHELAQKILSELPSEGVELYLATNIMLEIATLVSQRIGKEQGNKILHKLRSEEYIIIHPDEQMIQKAEDLFLKQTSKNISYSDCVSFIVCQEQDIVYVLSFDKHFKQRGFKRVGIDIPTSKMK